MGGEGPLGERDDQGKLGSEREVVVAEATSSGIMTVAGAGRGCAAGGVGLLLR